MSFQREVVTCKSNCNKLNWKNHVCDSKGEVSIIKKILGKEIETK